MQRRWSLIEEHHGRTANAADRLREELTSVFETSLALADVQLNVIMKKLSGWAAIIAVPTLVTSFVGMNVAYPLSGTHCRLLVLPDDHGRRVPHPLPAVPTQGLDLDSRERG